MMASMINGSLKRTDGICYLIYEIDLSLVYLSLVMPYRKRLNYLELLQDNDLKEKSQQLIRQERIAINLAINVTNTKIKPEAIKANPYMIIPKNFNALFS